MQWSEFYRPLTIIMISCILFRHDSNDQRSLRSHKRTEDFYVLP